MILHFCFLVSVPQETTLLSWHTWISNLKSLKMKRLYLTPSLWLNLLQSMKMVWWFLFRLKALPRSLEIKTRLMKTTREKKKIFMLLLLSIFFTFIYKTKNHRMSWNFTCWVGKSLIQLDNHSSSQAPVFIETTKAWLIISSLFILYSIAYQKIDQDIMKNGPHSLKGGLIHVKRVCFNPLPTFQWVGPFFSQSEDRF